MGCFPGADPRRGGGACAGCYFSGNEHFSCKVVAPRYQEIAYNHNNDVEFSNFQKEFRWSLVLQQYSMTIRHKSGISHIAIRCTSLGIKLMTVLFG